MDRPVLAPGDFVGAKLVLMIGGQLATLLRDHRPGKAYPGMWDLPGGTREPGESPEACVLREVAEELGLTLGPEALLWKRVYPSVSRPGRVSVCFAACLPEAKARAIRFGDEGQCWMLMPPEAFIAHPDAVPHYRDRVREALAALGMAAAG